MTFLFFFAYLLTLSYAASSLPDGLAADANGVLFKSCTFGSDTCGSGQGGSNAFCDSDGLCKVCPGSFCSSGEVASYVNNVGACEVACQTFQETTCELNNALDKCNGGTPLGGRFCNIDSSGRDGVCTDCQYVNTDPSTEFQCLNYPGFESFQAIVSCRTWCEQTETANRDQTDVDTALQETRFSDLELECGETGCCTQFIQREVCNSGSAALGFPQFAGTDYELDGVCSTRACGEQYTENEKSYQFCEVQIINEGQPCMVDGNELDSNVAIKIAGVCQEGVCTVTDDSDQCPGTHNNKIYDVADCLNKDVGLEWLNLVGNACIPESSSGACETIGRQSKQLNCYHTSGIPAAGQNSEGITAMFEPAYFDPHLAYDPRDPDSTAEQMVLGSTGQCIVGGTNSPAANINNCLITENGYYQYRKMDISWYQATNSGGSKISLLYIPIQTKSLIPIAACPQSGRCQGEIECSFDLSTSGKFPCDGAWTACEPKEPSKEPTKTPSKEPSMFPSLEPTKPPTKTPTENPAPREASSHGDPIIWTFNDECYDLNKDGLYLASSHPRYEHNVRIAVYNDFMRELQVLDGQGKIVLNINNMGDVFHDAQAFPYEFESLERECVEGMGKNECIVSFTEHSFDVQGFRYYIQLLRHDYLDPALKNGELGYHLDIYPRPYAAFNKYRRGYTGLYFENPLPETLEYCTVSQN